MTWGLRGLAADGFFTPLGARKAQDVTKRSGKALGPTGAACAVRRVEGSDRTIAARKGSLVGGSRLRLVEAQPQARARFPQGMRLDKP